MREPGGENPGSLAQGGLDAVQGFFGAHANPLRFAFRSLQPDEVTKYGFMTDRLTAQCATPGGGPG